METRSARSVPSAFVGRSTDFVGAGPFAVSALAKDLVLLRSAAGWRAFEGRCPHQGALLGEGELNGDTLVCRNHGWRFDAASGQRRGGPHCLQQYEVVERDGELWVELTNTAPSTAAAETPRRKLTDLPGPRSIPILGNIHQLDLKRLHLILEEWSRKYGPVFTYRMGRQRVLGIARAELIAQILRDRPETYRRAAVVQPVFEEMGVAGVFSAEGVSWRPQRRLAMQALSQKQLRNFYDSLRTITDRLVRRWRSLASENAAIDVVEEMKRFTVDVTTLLVFGYDVNTIENGSDRIQRHLELIFPTFNRRLFALIPTWRWFRMPADRRVDRALAELRRWLGERIADARAQLARDPELAANPDNFLQSMLTARNEAGQPFSDDVIYGNAMTMLLAGEDTTAFTLAWAIHHLCDAPSAVSRLRAEADTALDGVSPPDIDGALALEYAGAVANEAMRLRPVAPVFFLENNCDVTIDGIAVPRGTWIGLLTRPPAVHEQHFDSPRQFRPDRWLNAGDRAGAHDPAAHVPFGSGPRICPGRSLALLEMKLVLSALYRTFDIVRADGSAVDERFDFTMSPTNLRVRASPRR